jgi:hypothetical protein
MAVTKKDIQENNTQGNTPTSTPHTNASLGGTEQMSIGFGQTPFGLMASNQGSAYTMGVATALLEAYKQQPQAMRPKVSIFDKEVMDGIAYSTIVVSKQAGSVVYYYTILLEATGRRPMKASEVVAEVAQAIKSNQRPYIFTPDEAIDNELHKVILHGLGREYTAEDFVSVEGMVVNTGHDAAEAIAMAIAPIALNALIVESNLSGGDALDLNLGDIRFDQNMMLKIEANFSTPTSYDQTHRPVRSDWRIELLKVNTSNQFRSLNVSDSRQTLSSVSGFIDAIPVDVQLPAYPGMPATTQTRFRPHIIITNNDVVTPSIGFSLLGLISGMIITSKDMWTAGVVPRGDRTPGALNMVTNLEGNPNGIGSVLDLSGKKYTADEIYSTVGKMFSLEPIVSMDVPSFAPQTSYLSIFATAAQPGNSENKQAASKELIAAANRLTNGNFPADFPVNKIFASSGIIIPTGVWADKSGERDIRDIDLMFIASKTQDLKLMQQFVASSLPREISNVDSFLTRVDVISKIVPDAEINGKAIRVTFTPEFITTLTNSAVSAGLDVSYEPEIVFTENTGIGLAGQFYGNAGVTGASGFARHRFNNTQQQFNTGYSNMGIGRY